MRLPLKAHGVACLLLAGSILLLFMPALARGAIGLEQGREVRPKPQLLLFHGSSFLFEDPNFEAETREAAVAAGFVFEAGIERGTRGSARPPRCAWGSTPTASN